MTSPHGDITVSSSGEAVSSGHRLPPAGAQRAASVGSSAAQQVRLQTVEFLDFAVQT